LCAFCVDTFTFIFFWRTTPQRHFPPPPLHTTNDETPSAAIAVATTNVAPAAAVNTNVRRGRCRGAGGRTVGIPLGRQRRARQRRRQCARSRWIVVGIRWGIVVVHCAAPVKAPRNSLPRGGGASVGRRWRWRRPGRWRARSRRRGRRDCRRDHCHHVTRSEGVDEGRMDDDTTVVPLVQQCRDGGDDDAVVVVDVVVVSAAMSPLAPWTISPPPCHRRRRLWTRCTKTVCVAMTSTATATDR
jgi:hypothetical protein